MATLRGGPASGLTVPDSDRDVIWVAYDTDDAGRRIPMLDDAGHAVHLPDDAGPEARAVVNRANRRWECYRKVGTRPDGIDVQPGDDLPIPTQGSAYRWVCRR